MHDTFCLEDGDEHHEWKNWLHLEDHLEKSEIEANFTNMLHQNFSNLYATKELRKINEELTQSYAEKLIDLIIGG